MKKFLIAVLTGGLIMAQANAKSLVAYFSATGNTERLAKTTAKALDADIFEIVPAQKYTAADLDWNDRKSRSTVECNNPSERPAIAQKTDLSGYDTVVVEFPIWWYNAPKIIYTFMESYDFSGKKIVLLCTSGGSGLGRTTDDLKKVASGGEFVGGKRFNSGAGADEIKKYVEGLLK